MKWDRLHFEFLWCVCVYVCVCVSVGGEVLLRLLSVSGVNEEQWELIQQGPGLDTAGINQEGPWRKKYLVD